MFCLQFFVKENWTKLARIVLAKSRINPCVEKWKQINLSMIRMHACLSLLLLYLNITKCPGMDVSGLSYRPFVDSFIHSFILYHFLFVDSCRLSIVNFLNAPSVPDKNCPSSRPCMSVVRYRIERSPQVWFSHACRLDSTRLDSTRLDSLSWSSVSKKMKQSRKSFRGWSLFVLASK